MGLWCRYVYQRRLRLSWATADLRTMADEEQGARQREEDWTRRSAIEPLVEHRDYARGVAALGTLGFYACEAPQSRPHAQAGRGIALVWATSAHCSSPTVSRMASPSDKQLGMRHVQTVSCTLRTLALLPCRATSVRTRSPAKTCRAQASLIPGSGCYGRWPR